MALARQLGVSYNTAWLLNQKAMEAICERDYSKRLTGTAQVDDAFWKASVGEEGVAARPGRRPLSRLSPAAPTGDRWRCA